MKKILQIVDTYKWAIGTLSKAIIKYNPHYDWGTLEIHPKDLEQGKYNVEGIRQAILNADIIDIQYWRTASQLLEMIPELKHKIVILTHHNEKNLLSYEWGENIIHIAKTRYSENVLRERYPNADIRYIPNSFDPEIFKYNTEYPPKEKMVGYVGRIVPWKGLKEVARACYELNYPLLIMGKHDKHDYFESIPKEHRDNIRWDFFNCSDEDRIEYYKHITCYVGNSGSGREVGTLGFIEALATGVPVVSTRSGIAADLESEEENFIAVDYDDYDGLKEGIKTVMESMTVQQRLRKAGWEVIRNYNDERMALQYRKVFDDLLVKKPMVSFIIPTTPERIKELQTTLTAIDNLDYKSVEAVVVFDQANGKDIIRDTESFKYAYRMPIKISSTNLTQGYNLAMARNIGVIEADGEYLLFCDSRMEPQKDCVDQFLKVINTRDSNDKVWLFGEKGGEKKTFVENFSFIRRKQFITAGMCNERINAYGGMSQELRSRFSRQGFEFGYVPDAKAVQLLKSPQTPQKKDGIIKMKNLLFKLGMQ